MRARVILGTNFVLGLGALVYVLRGFGPAALAVLASRPSVAYALAFLGAAAAELAVFAARWRLLLCGLGWAPPLARLTLWRAAGQSVSALLPSGRLAGEPVRAWLAISDGVPPARAIAGVAVDRVLEMSASSIFACVFAVVLFQRGVPALEGAFVTAMLGLCGLSTGVVLAVRRLRQGKGVVEAVVRATGLDRLAAVREQLGVLAATDQAAADLLSQPRRIGRAFGIGVAANLLVLLEVHLLFAALSLPAGPVPVIAALFAAGAAHSFPVPAAVGVLEGAQMWLFGILGYPPAVGLAVALAVRAREFVHLLAGLGYLVVRPLAGRVIGRRVPASEVS